jgi:hypothetical protein
MWPFSAKEPLSAEKLPIPEAWAILKGHDPNGKTLIVRAHTGYGKFKGVAGYAHHVSIAVPIVDSDHEGFPTASEIEALNQIENDICEVFEPNRGALFVATTTIPGIREYILYTREPDITQQKFDNELLARVYTHKAHLMIRPDKDWAFYNKLL